MRLQIVREPEAASVPLPRYATEGAAGLDLVAWIPDGDVCTMEPGERAIVSTGLRIAVPPGYEAQVRARSGLAANHGVGLVNAPGTIDSDYRGVVKVIMINWGSEPFTVRSGDRIAQLVLAPVIQATIEEADTLSETPRAEGGFGSTGMRGL